VPSTEAPDKTCEQERCPVPGLTPHWSEAEAHAALGLPVTGGRLRIPRRIVGKILWPFFRHQVAVNQALLAELDAVRARLEADERSLVRAFGDLEHHSAVLVRHEEPLERHEFLLKHVEPAIEDLVDEFDLVQDKIDLGQRQALARYQEGIGLVRSAIAELDARVLDLEDASRAAGSVRGTGDDAWRRALDEVWLRMNQLDLYLTEARRSFPSPVPAERLAEIPSGFEALLPVFEEAFRGPYEVVQDRVAAYVDELVSCGGPVLDLGCGRGELLELLTARSVAAYGVDTSAEHVRRCCERGLDVRAEDARIHLASLPERSLGAITAIQLVEHLQTGELVEIIELAARALRPGGMLVLETQNPENVVVGSSDFYLDPTHERPLPPALLGFLVGARGFGDVEIRRLTRAEQAAPLERPKPDEPWSQVLTPLVDVVNDHLRAPADYAVGGRRP
jgi:O-antigen chain-terminating methyltransferase